MNTHKHKNARGTFSVFSVRNRKYRFLCTNLGSEMNEDTCKMCLSQLIFKSSTTIYIHTVYIYCIYPHTQYVCFRFNRANCQGRVEPHTPSNTSRLSLQQRRRRQFRRPGGLCHTRPRLFPSHALQSHPEPSGR